MSTFLELVNDCILESKQDVDLLTSANFANPPRTILYDRLKGWVKQSYIDLLEDRREWFFSNERGVVTIQPRLHLAKLDDTYVPQVGDVLIGDISGVSFEITEVFFSGESHTDPTECTVSVRYDYEVDPNQLDQWETFTATRGNVEWDAAGRIENRGTYDLSQYISTVDHVDVNSLSIKRSVLDEDFDGNMSQAMIPLRYVDWPTWTRQYQNFYSPLGEPRYVAVAPNGELQFYPYADGLYDVAFDYEQGANELVNWDDVPVLLPAKHHKLLVWKALKELADFNSDPRLYARVNKKYMERYGWLMRDYLPELTLGTSSFYRY